MRKKQNKLPQRLVVKLGTENLSSQGRLDQKTFNGIARQTAVLMTAGTEILLVSSGAIRAGKEAMEAKKVNNKLKLSKKELAGIGSPFLLGRWQKAFKRHDILIAQIWITYANWLSKKERVNVKNAISNCLKNGVVPIVNENDVVADDEVRSMERGISENDRLARMVALLIGADAVLFLTDVDGIFNENPRHNHGALMYKQINAADWRKSALINCDGGSSGGRGGMAPKINEAIICYDAGIRAAIAGNTPNAVLKFAQGKPVGTKIGNTDQL